MSTAGIILLVAVGAVCLFELVSLVLTIIKKKKLKKQQPEVEVNNVKQEYSETDLESVEDK